VCSRKVALTSSLASQMQRTLVVHFYTTLGEEPEVEVVLG
jgi:hypothetical protein